MKRSRAWTLALLAGCLGVSLGAAPATPTYIHIENIIARVQEGWSKPGATPDANAPGWNLMFEAIRRDLRAYTYAKSEDDRLKALGNLYQESRALDSLAWGPAAELRNEMRRWLRPRVMLAWASRRLVESVNGLPATSDPNAQQNRERWVQFVGSQLGPALSNYEGADSTRARQQALTQVHNALQSLEKGGTAAYWTPSYQLQSALNDLFNNPNLQATADASVVSSRLANYVVESGPVTRNGQTAYVTAGPYMGFGLMASDDGIMFYNRQALSSVTPINGFQQQVAADDQGRRAAKLYHFDATSTDQGVLTVIAVLRPTGIQLFPQATHNINATVGSAPQPGKGLIRGIASLIGQNQYSITQQVQEAAIPQIRQQVEQGSQAEAQERVAVREAQTNAMLRSVFVGPNTLAVKNFEVDGIHLRSRPQFVIVDGVVKWRGGPDQIGADLPRPAQFQTATTGVGADVHLPSLATNMAAGFFSTPQVQSVNNLMIQTKDVPPGTDPKQANEITQNVDFATYQAAVQTAKAANNPKVQAIRVQRPKRAPQFSVDRNGNLVAHIRDLVLEVPAPPAAAKGGLGTPPAQIYRLQAPEAELSVALNITPDPSGGPGKVQARIVGFEAGEDATVLAINEDEAQATALNRFTSTIVLAAFGSKLTGQTADLPVDTLNLPGFELTSISPIDPTGWMRIVLTPRANAPAPVNNAAPAVATTAPASAARD